MVIPDTHLKEVAKAMAGESFVTPDYYAFSNTLTTVDVTDTTMSGEYGSRILTSMSRNENIISYSATKTGALVSSSGEDIKGIASLSASSGGVLMTETVVPTISQTQAFDIEVITQITYTRP